jgi:malonate transporter and related proteins
LIVTTATADLKDVPVGTIAIALLASIVILFTALLATRPFLASVFTISGPAFASIVQAATRFNTYIALAISGALYGTTGLALISVAIVAMVPILNVMSVWMLACYTSDQKPNRRSTIGHMLRIPLIWSCLIDLALNLSGLPFPKIMLTFGEILGRASLALGLLIVGAGLILYDAIKLDPRVLIATVLKLIAMPLFAVGIGAILGLSGSALMVVAIVSSVPTAPTSYVLARQMGGDSPLLARILTFETVMAVLLITGALAMTEALQL